MPSELAAPISKSRSVGTAIGITIGSSSYKPRQSARFTTWAYIAGVGREQGLVQAAVDGAVLLAGYAAAELDALGLEEAGVPFPKRAWLLAPKATKSPWTVTTALCCQPQAARPWPTVVSAPGRAPARTGIVCSAEREDLLALVTSTVWLWPHATFRSGSRRPRDQRRLALDLVLLGVDVAAPKYFTAYLDFFFKFALYNEVPVRYGNSRHRKPGTCGLNHRLPGRRFALRGQGYCIDHLYCLL
eukprot:Mrub_04815.p2 GENE.Mrub_04815~~Mrub_04815.p2  ORF type:complete len:244 (+),score=39.02 Mrub_04815:165-896(+)